MDHEFELAEYGRFEDLFYRKGDLLKPAEHFAKIRPQDAARIDANLKEKAQKATPLAPTQPPAQPE